MQATGDTIRELAQSLNRSARKMPPRPVLWALASLTQDTEGATFAAECTTSDERTEWRVAALTATTLVMVEASAPLAHWTIEADIPGEKPDGLELSARVLPRSNVSCLEVVDVEHSGAWPENQEWLAQWSVHCHGLEPFRLPSSRRGNTDDATEQIAQALLGDL